MQSGSINRIPQRQEHCKKSLQVNRSIFNQIRQIQATGGKISSPPTKTLTLVYIGDMFKSPLIDEWYNSIFTNYEEMEKSTTFSAQFLRSALSPETKIFHIRIISG